MTGLPQIDKGHPWRRRSADLADWTWQRLINRRDAWGRYGSAGTYTAPAVSWRGSVLLTFADVVRHFRATSRRDVLGLHSTSPDNLCHWIAADIDRHGPDGNDPEATLRAALAWYGRAVSLGFRPLLNTSNGEGGYHLRVLFREAVPTPRAHAFARWLVRDHEHHRLPAVETFPKQPRVSPPGQPGQYGNWLRLPGKHYRRDYWSEVWTGERWLESDGAVAFILSLDGDDPALIPSLPPPPQRPRPGSCFRAPAPGGTALERRITAYLQALPNLGEGQGRDDVAYGFASFLVRDLRLTDDSALAWLEQWDAGNSPPKGAARLQEIIASAHRYGTRPYGCGLRHDEAINTTIRVRLQ